MSNETESELSRFREQWKEEVARSRRLQPAVPSSSAVGSKPKPHGFSRQKLGSRRLSESQSDGADERDEALDGGHQPTPAAAASTSETTSSAVRTSSAATSQVPETALEHYEKAVEKETAGNLGDSLNLYRKAFRMDHRVDAQYKAKHFPRPPPSTAHAAIAPAAATPAEGTKADPPAPPTGVNTAHHSSTATGGVGGLIASFVGLRIQPVSAAKVATQSEDAEAGPQQGPTAEEQEEAVKEGYSPLASIPYEILLHILQALALSDIASFVRLGHVCKALCYMVNNEDRIWRDVCFNTYSKQLWDWNVAVDGSELIDQKLSGDDPLELGTIPEEGPDEDPDYEKRKIPVDEEELPKYDDSWKKMLRLRPRVRLNGVYISTCNYLRQGNPASITWTSPVHIVTYYRYLRFYPDGSLLSLLTTHEPSEVVYSFSKHSLTPAHLGGLPIGSASLSWGKHVSRGRWRVDPEGRIDLEVLPLGMDRYIYRMQLRIRNARVSGRSQSSNKLLWEGFWSWNRLTDDLAEFSGRNDKPFFFSRVGMVEKELATGIA